SLPLSSPVVRTRLKFRGFGACLAHSRHRGNCRMGRRSNSVGSRHDAALARLVRVVGPARWETWPASGRLRWAHGSHSSVRPGGDRVFPRSALDRALAVRTNTPGGMESVSMERHPVVCDSRRSGIDDRLELLFSLKVAGIAISESRITLGYRGWELPRECRPAVPLAVGRAPAPAPPQAQPFRHRDFRVGANFCRAIDRRLGPLLLVPRGLFPSNHPGRRRSLPRRTGLRHASCAPRPEMASNCCDCGASLSLDGRSGYWDWLPRTNRGGHRILSAVAS